MKRLYKSKDKKIAGVCGGVADFFNIDPTFIRLIMCILTIISWGTGIIIYIIAALIMPDRNLDSYDDVDNLKSANVDGKIKKTNTSNKNTDVHSNEDFDEYFKN